MRVLVACEYSGRVREAFTKLGHFAMSCDLLPTDAPGLHYQGDVFDIIDQGWDLMIAHPPCTHLAVSGARHFKAKRERAVFNKKHWNLFAGSWLHQFPKSLLRIPFRSSAAKFASPTRLFNRGNLVMVKLRPLVCGSKACPNWFQRTSWKVEMTASTRCRRVPTGGRSVAQPTKVLQMQWQHSGADNANP